MIAVAFSVLTKWMNCKTLKQLLDNKRLGVSMNPILSTAFELSTLKKNLVILLHSFLHSFILSQWVCGTWMCFYLSVL